MQTRFIDPNEIVILQQKVITTFLQIDPTPHAALSSNNNLSLESAALVIEQLSLQLKAMYEENVLLKAQVRSAKYDLTELANTSNKILEQKDQEIQLLKQAIVNSKRTTGLFTIPLERESAIAAININNPSDALLLAAEQQKSSLQLRR